MTTTTTTTTKSLKEPQLMGHPPLGAFLAAASLALALLTSACATVKPMPFSEDAQKLSPTKKPIFLMTLTQRNNFKTSYQPKLLVANVERRVVKGSADRLNFTIDEEGKQETESPLTGNNYLVRLQLDEGDYVLRGFTSLNQEVLIHASFFAPLHAQLHVAAPGVYYLGHVEATVRERVGGELKAGAAIPLIDQSVAGASGGTFDVTVSDRWQLDEPRFRNTFSELAGVPIQKMILPPFNRPFAQKWWEDN